MNSNFLSEHFDNIKKILSKTNETEFVSLASLLMSGSFNEIKDSHDLLRKLYAYIIDVVNCIDESRNTMEKLCIVSNRYEYRHHGDNENDAEYLIFSYMVLVRFLIEYMYRNSDSFYVERITYAIDDYHEMDIVFKNTLDSGNGFIYSYVKNVYISKVIQEDFLDVKKRIEKFSSLENKIDIAISKSEEISNKYSQLQNIDSEYFEGFRAKLTKTSKELESGILAKVKIIEDLDEKVNKTNDNLTLKGLSGAYSELSATKTDEKNNALKVLIFSIISVLTPLSIRIVTLFQGIDYDIYEYILTGTATLIFIYYFRVALMNYNSIKTELNQIKLRTTLCKFIQGYVEFSQRNNNHESLSKFERLIFSNIIPDDKNIPATLDGMEQLAKLIEALKIK
ncbi:hypothetical protein U8233_001638 [Providencia rettgeri]|nr:hypothetical protein [Providencia rettgeri]